MRFMNRFRYGPRLAVALAGLTLLVSACGGAEMQSMTDRASPVEQPNQESMAVPQSADSAGGSGSPSADRTKLVPQDRAIIYTAEMTVRAKDVTASADRARQIVTTAGGYLAMENSDAHSDGEDSATLVFKIPPGNYPGTLDRLGKDLGTRESLQQNTEDVTEQVADVESRLRSAKAALDSLRTLLKRANTIGEVLKVERELSNRESELESLQARQKTLASQTSAATVTLRLVGPATVIPKKKDDEPAGFLSGLRTGWKAFVVAVKVGLTVLGVLLPWLLVIIPIWLLTVFLLRRNKRNDRPLTPGSEVPQYEDEDEEALPEDPRQEGRPDA